jgi:nucleoside-diphosphate-sugar epimerase
MTELRSRSVLVTGASGFIGGQLAEHLARQEGAKVSGTGRSFSNRAALQSAGVELLPADVRDAAAMAKSCSGKDIVCHLAAWGGLGGDQASPYDVNVTASRALAEAAARAGVQRFILVSTVAAYGLPPTDEVDEEVPLDTRQADLYGRTKALGEQAVREVSARTGLAISIVRPGMVYGPHATIWTVDMLRLIQKRTPMPFGDGSGFAFPIFIDDVLALLVRAMTHPQAVGEAFNVSGPGVTWEQFCNYYVRMCGRPLRRLPMPLARLLAWVNETLRLGRPLTRDRLKLVMRRVRFLTAKAESRLGWRQEVSLDDGMRRSEEWLRSAGHRHS